MRVGPVDVADVTLHFDVITARLEREACRPATVPVGVTALSHPDILIEIEGLAVRSRVGPGCVRGERCTVTLPPERARPRRRGVSYGRVTSMARRLRNSPSPASNCDL